MNRAARIILVLGLLAGLLSPVLAEHIASQFQILIAALLFLNAVRLGPGLLQEFSGAARDTFASILALQLGLPLLVLAVLMATGIGFPSFAFATVLLLAAPALTGSPNLVAMMGHDPVHAMQLLIVGVLAFPLTAFCVLWVMPAVSAGDAVWTTLQLAGFILSVVALGIGGRILFDRLIRSPVIDPVLDGMTALLLAVMVVGLMVEVSTLIRRDPAELLLWIAAALALNLTLQLGSYYVCRWRGMKDAAAIAVFAGNRNLALFLLALPADATDRILLFIGCYQIPMYLTPVLMRRFYAISRAA